MFDVPVEDDIFNKRWVGRFSERSCIAAGQKLGAPRPGFPESSAKTKMKIARHHGNFLGDGYGHSLIEDGPPAITAI